MIGNSGSGRPAIDLFCGAGGLSLGLQSAGFDIVAALDSEPAAVATHALNFAGNAVCATLAEVRILDLVEEVGIQVGELALVAGGPPCQGFSTQRRGAGKDQRNQLIVDFIEAAVALRPKAILMENVPGILGKRGRNLVARAESLIGSAGYVASWAVLDAADFGVPQHRRRAFLVAVPEEIAPFAFPDPSHYKDTWHTVRDAIEDLPEPPDDFTDHPDFANHSRRNVSSLNELRISHVPPGGDRRDIPWELQLKCHRESPSHRHLDVYGRMAWDEPAPTITAMFDSFTRGRFAHPVRDRVVTCREGARLQGFPDGFVFLGAKKTVARQIGNAVPPPLAAAVGRMVLSHLDRSLAVTKS